MSLIVADSLIKLWPPSPSSMPLPRLSLSTRLLITTLLLLAFGLVMIYSASVAEGLREFGNKWHFAGKQLQWSLAGLLLMLVTSRISTRLVNNLAPFLLGLGLVLLLLVAIPGIGVEVQGARRWLLLPYFSLQPAELFKLIQVIYLSAWFRLKKVQFSSFVVYLGLVSGLIMLEPDLGTTLVVVLLGISLYFLAGYPFRHLLWLSLGALAFILMAILAAPYRMARLTTFFNPSVDPLGSSYHIRQVILALGSGGVGGVGIGKSRQKYEYLPESTTDSIFAVVGEELGFLGALGLILFLAYLVYLVFRIATLSRDSTSSLLAAGVGAWLGWQILLNLSAMVALTPLTGVPLPLVSYGGSALLSVLLGLGLVLAVARENRL